MGSNIVIEHDVKIGKNCLIGLMLQSKNTIVGDNVVA